MAIGAGLAYYVFVHRPRMLAPAAPFRSTCGVLTEAERTAIDLTLSMSTADLIASGRARGRDQAGVVFDINAAAEVARARGCEPESRALAAKAQTVAAAPPPAPPPTPPQQLMAPSSAYVAYPAGVGNVDPSAYANLGQTPWSPPLAAIGDPANPPAAYMPAGAPAGAQAQSLPPSGPVIVRMRCRGSRCWVRPEPRPWDDAWGRFGFLAPDGFPVGVMHFAPEGWAHVEVHHPDHGRMEGFIELASLAADSGPVPGAAPGATPAGARAQAPGAQMPPNMRAMMNNAQTGGMNANATFMAGRPTASQRTRMRAAAMKKRRSAGSS